MLARGRVFSSSCSVFEIAEVQRRWHVAVGAFESDKAVIEITYASVYGERWRIRSDRMIPEHL
jgi:hypothetical protein